MAIALDTSATSASTSFSYTCTGSNLILFVAISWSTSTPSSTAAPTYNSVALTQVGAKVTNGTTSGIELWYLVAPSTGANTLALTLSATTGLCVNVASYTGVAQSSPIDVSTTAAPATFNLATSAAISVTTTVDNDWLLSAIMVSGSNATTEQSVSPGTIRQNNGSGTGSAALADTTTTTAGSSTMTWARSQATSRVPAIILTSFKPFTTAVATNNLMLLGVGQ